uniref:Uncharacterized protein n=1 Tax=Anguilla anguilla TaxID=7936 RepID=A0A0E9S0P6_ANGAN
MNLLLTFFLFPLSLTPQRTHNASQCHTERQTSFIPSDAT